MKTGQAARVEQYFYDIEELFIEQTNNAEGHWHTEVFHPAFGVPAVVQDANLVTSTFNYDGFGRFRSAMPGGGMKVAASYKAYQPVAGVNAGLEVSNSADDGSASIERIDELGRTFEQRERAFDGTWAVADTVFNLFGQATSTSRPGAGAPSSYRAKVTYDGLGRVVKSEEPDGAKTDIVYSPSSTGVTSTSTDADGDVRKLRTDLDGRVVQKQDRLDDSTLVTTQYTYQPFNQVEFVIDHLGNKTTAGFDHIGRKESVLDPDSGNTSYTYTGFDDLWKETNHTGTRTITCDKLGRVINIGDSDGQRFFAWDTAANGIGKLGRTESPDQVVVTYGYDTFSRPETTTVTVGLGPSAEQFATKLSYDPKGRPDTLTYPEAQGHAPFVVRNVYNSFGYLDRREDANDANTIHWKVVSRELDGALKGHKQDKLASSIVHDPATGRVKQFTASISGGAQVLSLSYDYYLGGDIWRRTDAVAGRLETFEYDGLNRLTGWSLSSKTNAFPVRDTTYEYDLIGNLTTVKVGKTTVDAAVYSDPRPHALTSLNGQKFSYDAGGRQYDGPKRTVTFNRFDLPKEVTDKGTQKKATYLYDADENRVRKTDVDGSVTTYIGGIYERRKVGSITDHVFMVPGEDGPAMQIVYRQGGSDTRYHLSSDLHGSVSVVLDDAMNVLERRYSEPFGGRVGANGSPLTPKPTPITRGFTGHEEERALGLVNMRGRIYDPAQRRFLTPDPLVAQPLFSQSYNRYSYVLNNPLRYTDPTGFENEEATTNSPFEPPPPLCGGSWRIKRVPEPHTGNTEVTWKWVPDETPAPAEASDDTGHADVARGGQIQRQALKTSLAQADLDAHAGRSSSPAGRRGAYAVPVGGGDKWNPYTDDGRASADVLGSKEFEVDSPETKAALGSLGMAAGHMLPGVNTVLVAADPQSSRADIALAVALDALTVVGAGVATKLASAAAKAARGAEAGAAAAKGAGTTLFHGSDVASVERIVADGLDKRAARALGGGDVFWTSPKPEIARIFAQANPAGGAPAVLGIRLPAGALERMQAAGIIEVERATGAVKVLNWKSFNSVAEFFRLE